jgi:hypothetical protein
LWGDAWYVGRRNHNLLDIMPVLLLLLAFLALIISFAAHVRKPSRTTLLLVVVIGTAFALGLVATFWFWHAPGP